MLNDRNSTCRFSALVGARGLSILGCAYLLAACSTTQAPGIEVRTVEVVREVQKPCPGEVPERPAPLGELPTDARALAAALGAKLAEWAAPGKYGDRAEAYFRACPPSE